MKRIITNHSETSNMIYKAICQFTDEKDEFLMSEILDDIMHNADKYGIDEIYIMPREDIKEIIELGFMAKAEGKSIPKPNPLEPLIRAIRESNMSIAEISRKSKICRRTIYNLIEGIHPPTANTIIKLSRAVELDDDTIIKILQLDEE